MGKGLQFATKLENWKVNEEIAVTLKKLALQENSEAFHNLEEVQHE